VKEKLLCAAFLLLVIGGHAQYRWQGAIIDGETEEPLPYASLYDSTQKKGLLADERGFFVLKSNVAPVALRISQPGYLPAYVTLIQAQEGEILSLRLQARPLDTVVIDDDHPATQGMVGRISFSMDEIRAMPALGGEADLVKALQMLPAASGGREGTSELHVRGGSRGQNLYMLDGIPINHSGHLFSIFSVFNPDVISQVDFYASGLPARFGGRLSSVVDVRVKEGNHQRWRGKIDLGVVSSKLMVEGPVGKRASLMVGARSSYLDVFNVGREERLREDVWEGGGFLNLGFSDLNAKYVFTPKQGHRLSWTLYGGNDRLLDFTNSLSNLREDRQGLNVLGSSLEYVWTPPNAWQVSTTLYAINTQTQVAQSRYAFRRNIIEPPDSLRFLLPEVELDTLGLESLTGAYRLRDIGGNVQARFTPDTRHQWEFGLQGISHYFRPGDLQFRQAVWEPTYLEQTEATPNLSLQAVEGAAHASYRWSPNSQWNLVLSGRLAGFQQGDTAYAHFLPRITLDWQPANWGRFQLAYDHTVQYMHLLARPDRLLTHSTWVPSTQNILPQRARQISAGIGGISLGQGIQLAGAAYYKWMEDLSFLPYDPAEALWVAEWEQSLQSSGRGRAYGTEWHLYVKREKWEASLNYALGWSERQFDRLNMGEWFPDEFDRRHQLNLSFAYPFHPNWKLTAFWTLNSGHRINLPIDRVGDTPYNFGFYSFESYNEFRLPLYHRLDLALEQRIDLPKDRAWGWRASVYNAYYRNNPYYLYLVQRLRTNPATQQQEAVDVAQAVSLFPIIPSLNLYFHF